MILRVEIEYSVDSENLEDAKNELEERLSVNTTVEKEFWDNAKLVTHCKECGITLSHDDELDEGYCLQCSAIINKDTITEL